MVTQTDADARRHPVQGQRHSQGLPGEEERCGQAADMHGHHPSQDDPVDVLELEVFRIETRDQLGALGSTIRLLSRFHRG